MHPRLKQLLFLLFFLSGFCGLLYQVIWVRLAFASFGIITPVLSIVISVFMLGLALGSWAGGALIRPMTRRTGVSAVVFYGVAEALIGLGAFAVPGLFSLGEMMLLRTGEADSFAYLFFSALVMTVSVLPWCFFMGTTFPLMMAFVRENDSDARSFSFLYMANVIGAMSGTLVTAAVLIEVFGFRRTLWIAGGLNALIAITSAMLGLRLWRKVLDDSPGRNASSSPPGLDGHPSSLAEHTGALECRTDQGIPGPVRAEENRPGQGSRATDALGEGSIELDPSPPRPRGLVSRPRPGARARGTGSGGESMPLEPTCNTSQEGSWPIHQAKSRSHLILFVTGFTSLALEVVWTRAFTPVMGTQVYAFALLLFVYLLATWIGSLLYRSQKAWTALTTAQLMALLAVFVFLPVILNDPRLYAINLRNMDPRINPLNMHVLPVLVSIFPFCAMLGYLTPQLIDESSRGNPRSAGRAYALNIVGCILGPLAASYLLLPWVGAKLAIVFLALPFLILFLSYFCSLGAIRWVAGAVAAALLFCSVFVNANYEAPLSPSAGYIVRRDHTATVISDGRGMEKGLSINGVVITLMTPITKFMAHLPLAFHPDQPQSALVICFGMGTTYRSLLSWDIQATAVELVPSVKEAFNYYFDDAPTVLSSRKGQIVIDDGRRFLRRTDQMFDVITIDPAPPAEAAGSSLLYSEQFYRLVKTRLKPDGILQQWFAIGEDRIQQAVVRSLVNSFPYVRAYPSVAGWGYHFLASMSPIEALTAEKMTQRLSERARHDLLEWSGGRDLKEYVGPVLSKEIPIQQLLAADPRIRITDDRPFNEYFWLRRMGFWRY
jgi:spermidine synthase